MRNELDLFVNVLECRSYAGVPARYNDINIAVIRQNTEGEYAMLEHEVNFDYHRHYLEQTVKSKGINIFRAFRVSSKA